MLKNVLLKMYSFIVSVAVTGDSSKVFYDYIFTNFENLEIMTTRLMSEPQGLPVSKKNSQLKSLCLNLASYSKRFYKLHLGLS